MPCQDTREDIGKRLVDTIIHTCVPCGPGIMVLICGDTVVSITQTRGTKIPVGSTIFLYQGDPIIEPPVLMPNLYGQTIMSAKAILDNMGFKYVGVCSDCITSEDSLAARVFSQSPEYFRGRKIGTSRTISFSAKVAFVRDPSIPISKVKKDVTNEDNKIE